MAHSSCRAGKVEHLASLFTQKYKESHTIEDLKLAIVLRHVALHLTTNVHSEKAKRHLRLADAYDEKHRNTRDLADLEAGIWHRQEALTITPPDDGDYPSYMEGLALSWKNKYYETQLESDLDSAIEHQKNALHLTMSPATWTTREDENELHEMKSTGNVPGIIYHHRLALALGLNDPVLLADYFSDLGKVYNFQYTKADSLEDLDYSIQYLEKAIEFPSSEQLKRAEQLQLLHYNYSHRYYAMGSLADLERAIEFAILAVDCVPKDKNSQELHVKLLTQVEESFREKYHMTQLDEDLATAFQFCQEALGLATDSKVRGGLLVRLADGLLDKYDSTRDRGDFERALEVLKDSLSADLCDEKTRPPRLLNIGHAHKAAYENSKNIEDLDLAISTYQSTLDLIDEEDRGRCPYVKTLAEAFMLRFKKTGAVASLRSAINLLEEVIDKFPDIPDWELLGRLADAYQYLYCRTENVMDFERAVKYYGEYISCVQVYDERVAAAAYTSMGILYRYRFHRDLDAAQLETSIDYYKRGLVLTPSNDVTRESALEGLAIAYIDRYALSKSSSDFELATSHLQEALDLPCTGYSSKANLLNKFSECFSLKYNQSRDIKDLDKAIQLSEESISLTTESHPDHTNLVHNLGSMLSLRHRVLKAPSDFERMVCSFQAALDDTLSLPADRVEAGTKLFHSYAKAGEWERACESGCATLGLVDVLSHQALQTEDKQYFLASLANLSSDVAAVAIEGGREAYDALQLLERGRGIIANSLNQRRLDLSKLKEANPSLVADFKSSVDLLYAPKSSLGKEEAEQRDKTGRKLQRTIDAIRQIPDFDRFLLPLSRTEMEAAAENGSIAVINVSKYRCDAFIIEPNRIYSLPLPQLTVTAIKNHAKWLERLTPDILEWLWETVACVVLDRLGYKDTDFVKDDDAKWPRLWWILTGPLSKFPIHAAGRYFERPLTQTVMHRVISSYSSSISMLLSSRRNSPGSGEHLSEKGNAVLIGMEELFYTTEEIKNLEFLCHSMGLNVLKPQPRRQDILSAMDNCAIFHFAGHASVNPSNPLQSHLVLNRDRITLGDLLDSNSASQPPFLAYLSACGTGQMARDELIDEGLHLIGACQVVGFRNVVGTLWKADDKLCADIATKTYESIAGSEMSSRSVCVGLHRAVCELRDQWIFDDEVDDRRLQEDEAADGGRARNVGTTKNEPRDMQSIEHSPMRWVPFIHFGG